MTEQKTIIAYKGFDKNLRCRDFQYEVGGTYKHGGEVVLCGSGFHACENPLDVWRYYDLTESRFAEVELRGDTAGASDDTKIAAAEIYIRAELTLPQFIKRAVDYVIELCI